MTRAERIELVAKAFQLRREIRGREDWLDYQHSLWGELDEALALPPDAAPTCAWAQDGEYSDTWATQCGQLWTFIEGSPSENSMKFCHNCGRQCVESFHEEASDDQAT